MAAVLRDMAAVERLHNDFGFDYAELARALKASEPTFHRWRRGTGGGPTTFQRERLRKIAAFVQELDALFHEKRTAVAWLERPLPDLEGRTPREMILAGNVDRATGVLYALNASVSL